MLLFFRLTIILGIFMKIVSIQDRAWLTRIHFQPQTRIFSHNTTNLGSDWTLKLIGLPDTMHDYSIISTWSSFICVICLNELFQMSITNYELWFVIVVQNKTLVHACALMRILPLSYRGTLARRKRASIQTYWTRCSMS